MYGDDIQKEELFRKFDLIRKSVSAQDVGRALGLDVNRAGRCRCPFHNGADRNMIVYSEPGRGFYCFVCHEGGDCIKLAQKLLGDGFRYSDGARWVDKTFQLNILENKRPSLWERRRRAELYAKRFGGRQA